MHVLGGRALVRPLAAEHAELREQLRDAAPVGALAGFPARAQGAFAVDEEFDVVSGSAEERVGRGDLRIRAQGDDARAGAAQLALRGPERPQARLARAEHEEHRLAAIIPQGLLRALADLEI